MKYIYTLISILMLLTPLSCSADTTGNNLETVNKLLNHYFPNQQKQNNSKVVFKTGDFNGDGLEDIVALFKPKSKPAETSQLRVSTPWSYSPDKKYHRSLVIFQKAGSDWFSGKTQVFALLATTGVLETPSFKLIVSDKSDKDYREHTSMLPLKTNNALIILPTEAGIDTYVYWDKVKYTLFEPEEIP
ncbi:MAG TPA: hypothetical protein ENJ28_07290 [Gammaproteobacteria bacterium]|nr:hypothetical protein [Gammaproteobacteria bacterium]